MTTNAWQIHYHGSDTVGSVLERLERVTRELQQAITAQAEALQEALVIARDAAGVAEAAQSVAEDARDLAAEREA